MQRLSKSSSFGGLKKFFFLVVLMGAPLLVVASLRYFPTASNQGYAPVQPIPFNHEKHATQFQIPCLYCHSSAEKSRHASIPALGTCMNCHSIVKLDSPHIQTLRAAYFEKKPIEWVRVHELPDYVYFPHKRHVLKGIDCQVCHGDVQKMTRVEQKASMTMGWCMECHRGKTAPKHVLQEAYPGVENPQGPVAPTSCSTCHR
jgi:hypothetical protein